MIIGLMKRDCEQGSDWDRVRLGLREIGTA